MMYCMKCGEKARSISLKSSWERFDFCKKCEQGIFTSVGDRMGGGRDSYVIIEDVYAFFRPGRRQYKGPKWGFVWVEEMK
jgi:hypothetical protein